MSTLPSLRKKIRQSFFVFLFFYILFGTFLAIAIVASSPSSFPGDEILVTSAVYFLITLLMAIFLADGFSDSLSRPLKNLVEVLQQRPPLGQPLKLPEPSSLELLILVNEINHVWNRLSEAAKLNLDELVLEKFKLETVLEFAEDALLVLDSDQLVIHFNEQLLKLIQLNPQQVLNSKWNDLPATNENYLKLRDALHRNIEEGVQLDLDLNHQKRTFSVRWRQMRGIGQHISGSLFLLHDVTEKLQRENFKSNFIDLLSNELKAPLKSLDLASKKLMSETGVPNSVQGIVETISDNLEKIRVIASEFASITKTQLKSIKLRAENISLNQVIEEWISPFRPSAKERHVNIEFVLEGSENILANIDAIKFPWVISTILANSLRFSPPETTIVVSLSDRNSHEIEINIKDEGPRLSEEDEKRVFDPFLNVELQTPTGNRAFFGMGFTIAKEIVEAHEGRIEYYSRTPTGSEFRILLPSSPA